MDRIGLNVICGVLHQLIELTSEFPDLPEYDPVIRVSGGRTSWTIEV